jgi:hypothetical protein
VDATTVEIWHFEHKIGLCVNAFPNSCLFPGVKWHDVSCNHEKPIVCEDEPGHLNFVLGKKWLFVPLTLRIPILSPDRTAYIQRRPTALLGSCGYGSVCYWSSRIRISQYFVGIRIISSTSEKSMKSLDFYHFVTSSWHFISVNWYKCTFKK